MLGAVEVARFAALSFGAPISSSSQRPNSLWTRTKSPFSPLREGARMKKARVSGGRGWTLLIFISAPLEILS
jgi:hypothetical protein